MGNSVMKREREGVRKAIKIVLIVIVALLIVLFAGMSIFTGIQVFANSTQLVTNEKTKGASEIFWDKYGLDYENFCNTYQIESFAIASTHNDHMVPADYIYAPESQNSKNHPTVIMSHGKGGNRYSNYPIAEFFLQQGYNVVTFDQRSSNENTARYTTFGYLEKFDLIDLVNYVAEHAPGQRLGVWGASFGGATVGLALGYKDMDDKIDFAILECPISSMQWMLEETMGEMDIGIPLPYLIWCGNIVTKLKLGFSYRDAEVARAMRDVTTPVLIINSKADRVTPYFMGKEIYDALPGSAKEIWTVEDSGHCIMWREHNQEYRDLVQDFLSKY
jgi:fermentation-respiration switch protein FrsA (DUF1100 family)